MIIYEHLEMKAFILGTILAQLKTGNIKPITETEKKFTWAFKIFSH